MSEEEIRWRVLNPTAESEFKEDNLSIRLPTLTAKKIGLFSNNKPGVDFIFDSVMRLLSEKFNNIDFEKFSFFMGVGDENIRRMAKCDAVIAGIGD